jgi:hypothetical protein
MRRHAPMEARLEQASAMPRAALCSSSSAPPLRRLVSSGPCKLQARLQSSTRVRWAEDSARRHRKAPPWRPFGFSRSQGRSCASRGGKGNRDRPRGGGTAATGPLGHAAESATGRALSAPARQFPWPPDAEAAPTQRATLDRRSAAKRSGVRARADVAAEPTRARAGESSSC